MNENRADSFLRLIRRSQRGKLKIYLGYCAGVGKTYQMLQEGQRLRQSGIDIAVGLVETHGRRDTELLVEGLDVIPRHQTVYRGIEIGEMDLAAILARHPAVVLVDELAHTNVPGSKNGKRYQDVEEILAAGIHVISTLNVQHLESLYDLVEHTTGVKVKERIPDKIVAEADQIVNVDLTTEDLRQRLQDGKIYPTDRIETALTNFFQPSNLEQLRELTLRELASQIDFRRRDLPTGEEVPASPDQVMVCLSSKGPNSDILLRYASRFAGRLNRNWYAVYVQTESESPTAIDAETQRILCNTLTLAQQLGATVFTYKGNDVVKTILQFAKEYRVGHIVIGSPGRDLPFWRRLLGQRGIVERLVKEGKGVTVVVLDTSSQEPEIVSEPVLKQAPKIIEMPAKTVSRLALPSDLQVLCWEDTLSKTAVIDGLLNAACRRHHLDRSAVAMALTARENQGSTFLGRDVAVPHARIAGLTSPILVVGIVRNGVFDWQADVPVRVIFLLLSPTEPADIHVRMLGQLSRLAQNDILIQNLKDSADPAEVFHLLADWQMPT